MLYKLNSEGPEVVKIQKALIGKGFLTAGAADGFYGPQTKAAAIGFQKTFKLNADGVIGPLSWKVLFNQDMPEPTISMPLMQGEVDDVFGDPRYSGFKGEWIVLFDLHPWQVHFGSLGIPNKIEVNRIIVQPLTATLNDLAKTGLAKEIRTFDGCWWVRNQRDSDRLSQHSWGIAIDWNAALNPFRGDRTWSDEFVKVWCKHGWEAGACWTDPRDPMHFQYSWTRDWRSSRYADEEFRPVLKAA